MKSLALWIIVIILLCTLVPVGSCLMCGVITCGALNTTARKVASVSETVSHKIISITPTSQPSNVVQFKTNCNVRELASTKSDIVGMVLPFRPYHVLERKGKWRKIQVTDDVAGWVGCQGE